MLPALLDAELLLLEALEDEALEDEALETCAMDDELAMELDDELAETAGMLCAEPDGAAAFASEDDPPQEASKAIATGTTRSVEAIDEWRIVLPIADTRASRVGSMERAASLRGNTAR